MSRIRAGIIAEETIEYRRFFWASFCEVVRIVSNSRDCTYKLHIKEKKDIDAYAVDAVDLFKTTLQYNIAKYNEFYSELQKRGHLKKNGSAYKGQVKIVLSDSIAYLNHSKQNIVWYLPHLHMEITIQRSRMVNIQLCLFDGLITTI